MRDDRDDSDGRRLRRESAEGLHLRGNAVLGFYRGSPYDAESLATLAYMIATSGDWPRGVTLAEKANALNADATVGWYNATLYLNYYLTGDYERALELIRQTPDQQAFVTSIDYLPILGPLGRKAEALEKWQKVLAEDPS